MTGKNETRGFVALLDSAVSSSSSSNKIIKTKAKQSSLLKTAVTYLVLAINNGALDLTGYFTLSTKALRISGQHLSNTSELIWGFCDSEDFISVLPSDATTVYSYGRFFVMFSPPKNS